MNSLWYYRVTIDGEEWTRDGWLVSHRRGDPIFNVFRDGIVVALGFANAEAAKGYADRFH